MCEQGLKGTAAVSVRFLKQVNIVLGTMSRPEDDGDDIFLTDVLLEECEVEGISSEKCERRVIFS